MRTTSSRAKLIRGFLLIASAWMFLAHTARAAAGPTKENALEAEKELAQAMRTNDADGFCRLLDPDWAVVDGIGGLNDAGKASALRSGRAPLRERPMSRTWRMPECASTATSQL